MEKLPLQKLQESFQSDILKQRFKNPKLLPWVIDSPTCSSLERLHVYQKGCCYRFLEILEIDFPRVQQLLGKRNFEQCVLEFSLKYPSVYRSANFYGERFPKFIRNSHWSKKAPALSEVAFVEWEMSRFYFAATPEFRIQEQLSLVSENNYEILQFEVVEYITLFSCHFDLTLKKPKKSRTKFYFRVYRKQFDGELEKISREEFHALQQIRKGKTLSQVLESLYRKFKFKDIDQWQKWFVEWVRNGILYSVKS